MIFALAIADARSALSDAGIAFVAKKPARAPFWCFDEAKHASSSREVVEATFVDDTSIALVASSPSALVTAIRALMRILVTAHSHFALRINFNRGKTEGIMRLRGHKAVATLDSLRSGNDIAVELPPPYEAQKLLIVSKYKHLGSYVTANGSPHFDAQHRCSAALSADVPLATRIFGSPEICLWLKFHFMHALILTRLMYNTQTWVPTTQSVKKINGVYMRVLRRIADGCRYRKCAYSDLEIRRRLGIEGLLVRRRLCYLGRVLRTGHGALLAMLSIVVKDDRLPWVKLIVRDMRLLYDNVADVRRRLPAPCADPFAWAGFVKDQPVLWHDIVMQLYFIESSLDSVPSGSAPMAMVCQHVCETCPNRPAFASAKALHQHCRKMHGYRDPTAKYINGSGVCPACKTNFKTRLRVLAHVSDVRRPKCRDVILSGAFPEMSCADLSKLALADREARKQARRDGHTHPLAVGSATTARGKRIGHVQF